MKGVNNKTTRTEEKTFGIAPWGLSTDQKDVAEILLNELKERKVEAEGHTKEGRTNICFQAMDKWKWDFARSMVKKHKMVAGMVKPIMNN